MVAGGHAVAQVFLAWGRVVGVIKRSMGGTGRPRSPRMFSNVKKCEFIVNLGAEENPEMHQFYVADSV
jgi:hypothetical protein